MTYFNLYTPINELGYGRLGRGLMKGLKEIGANEYSLSPIGNNLDIENKQEANEHVQRAKMYKWFRNYPSVAIWHEFDLNKFSSNKLVAFPIFETSAFTEEAINYLTQMNAVFVLSHWAKGVVESAIGNSVPCFVVPGAANKIENEEINKIKKSSCFTFLNIGKYEVRKSPLELIKAYLIAFADKKEETRLICHIYNPFDGQFKNNMMNILKQLGLTITPSSRQECIIATKGSCVVEIPAGRIPEQQIFQLYKYAHVGVFPSKAEGWNLPLMEALQSDLPCIATNYSAHTEYLNQNYNYNSDLLLNKFNLTSAYDGVYFQGNRGDWAIPDVEEIAEKMLYSYYNYNEVLTRFDNKKIKEDFTWANTAKNFLGALSKV